MPLRRKIIHDTSSSSSSPPGNAGQQIFRPAAQLGQCDASALLAIEREVVEPAAKLVRRAAEGSVVVVVISSDDSEPGSPQPDNQEQAVVLPEWNPLQFAATHGHFPTADDVPMVGVTAASDAAVLDCDDGYLWNAVPPTVCQYLDLEAACVDDTSSGSSDGSDGELTPGFIDDIEPEKENIAVEDVELLRRMFPKTYKYECVVLLGCNYDVFNMSLRLISSRRPQQSRCK
jgi:hypothetical protein